VRHPTVEGVQPGDKLVQVDALRTKGASFGTIFAALHGKPGDARTLLVERNGKTFQVRAKVTAF